MIVVTGGAGFIGSNLVAALEEHGEEVAVVDRLGAGEKWRNLGKRELAALVPPEDIEPFLEARRGAIDAVIHMGAVSSTTETDADRVAQTNFTLSLFLWEWCARHGKRLIYASSAATYGDGRHGFDDDGSTAALARLRPLNAYGWSKHLFDRRVARLLEAGAPRPPQWAGLKFFNVYGPNEYHKGAQASVAWHLFRRIQAGEKARLFRSHDPAYADGGQLRDFVSVGDCVDVVMWLHAHPGVSGLFNVGSGKARSFLDLARAVHRAMGKPLEIEWVDTPPEIREKYQYFTEAAMARLRAAGYAKAATTLEDGVTAYVRDYLRAPDPYR